MKKVRELSKEGRKEGRSKGHAVRHGVASDSLDLPAAIRQKVVPLDTAIERNRQRVLGFYEAFAPRTPEQDFTKGLGLLIAHATTTTAITARELANVLQRFTGLVARAGKIGPREAMSIVLDAEAGTYGAGK